MARFRSKPVEIEATQWFKDGDHPAVYGVDRSGRRWVTSAQGEVSVDPGDWIITEPKGGGYYPCKPEVFALKYEPIELIPLSGETGEPMPDFAVTKL